MNCNHKNYATVCNLLIRFYEFTVTITEIYVKLLNYMAYQKSDSALHVIYIPGLGDHKVGGQQRAVSTWKQWGVTPELFQMKWADGEAWEDKFSRLLDRIDELNDAGTKVALVGASAGASAVINAFAARKDIIVGSVLLSGKVNRPGAVGESFKRNNPAFWTSINDCQKALASLNTDYRGRILSRYGVLDEMVPYMDSVIKGARNRVAPTAGHAFNIGSQLLVGAPSFIKYLKKL
jgi:hypothetical protein